MIYISLGWNCDSVIIKKNIFKQYEELGHLTTPFDLCITPYSGLCECIKTDFTLFFNLRIVNGIIMNEYNMWFNQETNLDFFEFKKIYDIRIRNFKTYLGSNNKINFIISNPFDNINVLQDIIQTKYPDLNFKIIVLRNKFIDSYINHFSPNSDCKIHAEMGLKMNLTTYMIYSNTNKTFYCNRNMNEELFLESFKTNTIDNVQKKTIALIISGQPRTNKLTRWFHKNLLMNNYECDVFLSIDTDNSIQLLYKNSKEELEQTEIQEILDFYKPVDYYITDRQTKKIIKKSNIKIKEKPAKYYETSNIDEKIINQYLIGTDNKIMDNKLTIKKTFYVSNCENYIHVNNKNWRGLLRQFFFINKGYELLENYIKTTGKKYDTIIRMRFDYACWDKEFKEYDLFEKVYNPYINFKYNLSNINLAKTLTLCHKINVDDSEENTIKVLGGGVYNNYTYVNDFFWTHGPDLIDKLKNFYLELPNIINNSIINCFPLTGAGIEHYFSIYLFNNNINIKKSCMHPMTVVREFD